MPRNTTVQKRTATAQSTTVPITDKKSKLARQIEIIKKLREHERYNKIEYYDPYPFQKDFSIPEQTVISDYSCAGTV